METDQATVPGLIGAQGNPSIYLKLIQHFILHFEMYFYQYEGWIIYKNITDGFP